MSERLLKTGYPFVREWFRSDEVPDVDVLLGPSSAPQRSAVERTHALNLGRKMNPRLKFMCGPLLRYDTTDEDCVWHGAALIVSECRYILPPLESQWVLLMSPRLVGPRS